MSVLVCYLISHDCKNRKSKIMFDIVYIYKLYFTDMRTGTLNL